MYVCGCESLMAVYDSSVRTVPGLDLSLAVLLFQVASLSSQKECLVFMQFIHLVVGISYTINCVENDCCLGFNVIYKF